MEWLSLTGPFLPISGFPSFLLSFLSFRSCLLFYITGDSSYSSDIGHRPTTQSQSFVPTYLEHGMFPGAFIHVLWMTHTQDWTGDRQLAPPTPYPTPPPSNTRLLSYTRLVSGFNDNAHNTQQNIFHLCQEFSLCNISVGFRFHVAIRPYSLLFSLSHSFLFDPDSHKHGFNSLPQALSRDISPPPLSFKPLHTHSLSHLTHPSALSVSWPITWPDLPRDASCEVECERRCMARRETRSEYADLTDRRFLFHHHVFPFTCSVSRSSSFLVLVFHLTRVLSILTLCLRLFLFRISLPSCLYLQFSPSVRVIAHVHLDRNWTLTSFFDQSTVPWHRNLTHNTSDTFTLTCLYPSSSVVRFCRCFLFFCACLVALLQLSLPFYARIFHFTPITPSLSPLHHHHHPSSS